MTDRPQTAADIMTRNVISVRPEATITQARALMTEHSIRHLPVVGASGDFKGVVTQKAMLGEILRIVDRYGIKEMERQTEQRAVGEILGTDVEPIQQDLPLADAGKFFLTVKHGCLPVLDNGRLVGILTSAGFVKLSVRLLEN